MARSLPRLSWSRQKDPGQSSRTPSTSWFCPTKDAGRQFKCPLMTRNLNRSSARRRFPPRSLGANIFTTPVKWHHFPVLLPHHSPTLEAAGRTTLLQAPTAPPMKRSNLTILQVKTHTRPVNTPTPERVLCTNKPCSHWSRAPDHLLLPLGTRGSQRLNPGSKDSL